MRRRALAGRLAAVAALALLAARTAAGAALPPAEAARIERLLQAVAAEPELRFERNGRQVDGADAARFLRAKWQSHGAGVSSAEAFIDQVATRSSTTGRAYRVCAPDGRCVEAAGWLRERLRAADAAR